MTTIVLQLVGLLCSAALYIVLLGPSAGGIFLAGLAAHALGHAAAAAHFHFPCRIWFVPGLGVFEVIRSHDEVSPMTRAIIAVSGPTAGTLFTAALFIGSRTFPDLVLPTLLLAGFNNFNLLPIPPLDGGQAVRALLAMRRTS
jgi:Zn-dependent protease